MPRRQSVSVDEQKECNYPARESEEQHHDVECHRNEKIKDTVLE